MPCLQSSEVHIEAWQPGRGASLQLRVKNSVFKKVIIWVPNGGTS